MLKEFGTLPTERRAKEMRDRDYLWCAVHLMLDDEERLDALCPDCRSRVERGCCPSCGGEVTAGTYGVNEGFDWTKFNEMKGAGRRDG